MRKRGGLGKGLAALIPAEAADDSAPAPQEDASTDKTSSVSRETDAEAAATQPQEPEESAVDSVSRETSESSDTDLAPVPGARYQLVPLAQIDVNPKQPREVFEEESLEELKTSLKEVGLLQPIAVRRRGESFELIMGERRTRAARELDWETIPAIVREIKDEDLLRDALLENIHRVQLNPLEEGAAYQQLLDEFGVTQEELSRRIGRSRPQISNMIRLLSLPGTVQRRVAAGVLSAGHARALLSLESSERQDALAARIVAEGLSVRATEEVVSMQSGAADESQQDVSRETSPQRTNKLHAPGLSDLADRLSDHFDTRVKVNLGKKKGRVVIEFSSVADLERIAKNMGVEES